MICKGECMEPELQKERHELVMERILEIREEKSVPEKYRDYFGKTAELLLRIDETSEMAENGSLHREPLEEAKARNKYFYQDILEENYEKSYANPAYAVACLGEEFGGILSFLYTDLRACIGYAYEGRKEWITMFFELLSLIHI